MKHYNTIRSILLAIDEDILVREFIKWTQNNLLDLAIDEFVALEGKAIKSTTSGGNT